MKKLLLIAILLAPLNLWAYSGTRTVTGFTDVRLPAPRSFADEVREGNLRIVLDAACRDEGDDVIVFAPTRLPEFRILLDSPLVIPAECRGQITLRGREDVDVILDASRFTGGGEAEGDLCTIDVYSNHHTIENLALVGNGRGAGVCLFGRENTVSGSRFGVDRSGRVTANRYGVVVSDHFAVWHPGMDGQNSRVIGNEFGPGSDRAIFSRGVGVVLSQNRIEGSLRDGILHSGNDAEISQNEISTSGWNGLSLDGEHLNVTGNRIVGNGWGGIQIRATDSSISNNTILANGGCSGEPLLASQSAPCLEDGPTGGPGVLIVAGSRNLVVGGDSFENDRNIIQYNRDGGVVILGDATSEGHRITHNTISRNYGPEPDLDLSGNGLTANDPGDPDEGPNHLLNFVDYIQAFPLVPSATGEARYWTWGLARSGASVELYGVPIEDEVRRTHGGGETFYGESPVTGRTFRIAPDAAFASLDDQFITMLSFDLGGNTSEFSSNATAGRDQDLDGIVDSRETGDGTLASGGSSPESTDSDSDGLPDSVEDVNRNGVWDRDDGETSAYSGDTDGDGVGDWAETHGDGIYDAGSDIDPLNPDTDGDGLSDGAEDRNGDGIWENYQGESSPLLIESDGDGVFDATDNCPSIPNPGQESWFCTP